MDPTLRESHNIWIALGMLAERELKSNLYARRMLVTEEDIWTVKRGIADNPKWKARIDSHFSRWDVREAVRNFLPVIEVDVFEEPGEFLEGLDEFQKGVLRFPHSQKAFEISEEEVKWILRAIPLCYPNHSGVLRRYLVWDLFEEDEVKLISECVF